LAFNSSLSLHIHTPTSLPGETGKRLEVGGHGLVSGCPEHWTIQPYDDNARSPQTDRRTDTQTDRRTNITAIARQFVLKNAPCAKTVRYYLLNCSTDYWTFLRSTQTFTNNRTILDSLAERIDLWAIDCGWRVRAVGAPVASAHSGAKAAVLSGHVRPGLDCRVGYNVIKTRHGHRQEQWSDGFSRQRILTAPEQRQNKNLRFVINMINEQIDSNKEAY